MKIRIKGCKLSYIPATQISDYIMEGYPETDNTDIEFANVLIDANDNVLYGVRVDGTIYDATSIVGEQEINGVKIAKIINAYKRSIADN